MFAVIWLVICAGVQGYNERIVGNTNKMSLKREYFWI